MERSEYGVVAVGVCVAERRGRRTDDAVTCRRAPGECVCGCVSDNTCSAQLASPSMQCIAFPLSSLLPPVLACSRVAQQSLMMRCAHVALWKKTEGRAVPSVVPNTPAAGEKLHAVHHVDVPSQRTGTTCLRPWWSCTDWSRRTMRWNACTHCIDPGQTGEQAQVPSPAAQKAEAVAE